MAATAASTVPLITTQTRNKISQVNLITLQSLTSAPRVVMSSELDTTNILSTSITIHLGRTSTNVFQSGINFRIEASSATSGDGYWFPVTIFTSALGTGTGSQNVNGTAAAGQKVIPIAATANFSVGDIVYIQNTTISNSEFGRIAVVTANTSITLEDNLRFSQPATSIVTSKSEMYYALIDTSAIERLRIVVDGTQPGVGATFNFDTEALAIVGA